MSAHETNKLLKYGGISGSIFLLLLFSAAAMKSCSHGNNTTSLPKKTLEVKNMASGDNEAESLNTLTADLNTTKKQIAQVIKDNNDLRQSNIALKTQLSGQSAAAKDNTPLDKSLSAYPISSAKNFANASGVDGAAVGSTQASSAAMTDVNVSAPAKLSAFDIRNADHVNKETRLPKTLNNAVSNEKPKPIPFYTIPPNATAIHDQLMTALVGRIPVKGVVTDPYPFKIVFSDDTLAANGLRVPHLKQMIVSGFTEGDVNLRVVRGWVTSLTFVFEDGTISSITSNDNNIGKFTKENALGYLTDQYGNPIQGTLITNAPEYLGTKVALGVTSGFATAYAQSQVSNQSNAFGGNSSTVTGSPLKFMLGQGATNGANQAQNWFDERAENSFDAIYVPTIDKDGKPVEISVNFAKEIPINYDPNGRRVSYEHDENTSAVSADLD